MKPPANAPLDTNQSQSDDMTSSAYSDSEATPPKMKLPADAPLDTNQSQSDDMTSSTYSDSEAMIAIMGPTGAGKSSFIKLLTGSDEVVIGENLESETSDVRVIRWETEDGVINLIDTPGFDDSRDGITDAGVLEMIATFLLNEYQDQRRHLNGLIYFHPISDARVTGSARRNLRMFQGLCGSQALKNVVIATSKWDMVKPALGAKREQELKSKPTLFKPLVDAGATMFPHDNGLTSALRIISYIRELPSVQAVIVDELLAGKTLGETTAADALKEEIQALLKKNEEDRIALEKEMQDAIKAKDTELQRVIEEERKAREEDKAKLQQKQDILNSQITRLAEENKKMQASLEAKEEDARRERKRTEAEFTRIREEDRKAREADKAAQERSFAQREKERREEDRKAREAEKTAQEKLFAEKEKERREEDRKAREAEKAAHEKLLAGKERDLQRIRDEQKKHQVDTVADLRVQTEAKFTFAFVGKENEGYYVLKSGSSRWKGCPVELDNALSREGAGQVRMLFAGPDGKYLLRTRSRIYSYGVSSGVPKDEVALYAFGKGETWFARLQSGRCIWSGLPSSLGKKIAIVGGSKVKTLSFGADNCWAMTYGDGKWATDGVHSGVNAKLRSLSDVKNIVLSPWDPECWFIEYGDGLWSHYTQASWHEYLGGILKK